MRKANRWSWLAALMLTIVVSFTASTALAGSFVWSQGPGLEGGTVRALAYDPITGTLFAGTYGGGVLYGFGLGWITPSTPPGSPFVNAFYVDTFFGQVFACTEGGVFVTADGGDNWSSFTSNLGPDSSRTTGVVFDPVTFTFFVTTNGGGVFQLIAGVWTQVNTGLVAVGSKNVNAITTDGVGTLYIATNNGVYSSPSAAINWTSDSVGLTGKSVLSLINDGANLYAGTNGAGFFVSPLGPPLAWIQANGTAPNLLTGTSVRALTGAFPFIFAATNAGVFFTFDTGANWFSLNGSVLTDPGVGDINLFALALDGLFNLHVGGVRGIFSESGFLSTTWVANNNGLSPIEVRAIVHNPKNSNIVYTATNGGVYKSEDYGNTWTSQFNGMPDKDVTALAISNVNPNILYAGTDNGIIYKSTDGGSSWQQFKSLGGIDSRVNDIKFSPFSSADVWFGGDFGLYHLVNGAFAQVQDKDDVLFGAIIYSIAIDPKTYGSVGSYVYPKNIYVGTNTGGAPVARSFDGGIKWSLAAAPQTEANDFGFQVLVDPIDTKRIYVVCPDEFVEGSIVFGGINISEDRGETFFTNPGMENDDFHFTNMLAIDPVFNNKIYMATTQYSVIGDITFKQVPPGGGVGDDLTVGGTYLGAVNKTYVVQIDTIGVPDTFRWSDSGGAVWNAVGVAITGAAQTLNEGIDVTFENTTGHLVGDQWTFTAFAADPTVWYTTANFGNLFFFDQTGLPLFLYPHSTEVIAVNPQYTDILVAGTQVGPFQYENFFCPPGAVSINNGDDYTKSTAVTLKLIYCTITSQMRFSNDGVNWSSWMAVKPTAKWTLLKGTGLKTVYAEFKDKSGFTTSASDNIFLDATKPIFASVVIDGGAVTFGAAQTLTLAVFDDPGGSGIKEFRLSNSSTFNIDPNNPVYSDWFPFPLLVNPVPWNLKQGGGTALKVYGQFRDYSGNVLQVVSASTNNGLGLNNVPGPPPLLNAVQNPAIPQIVNLSWDDNSDNEKTYVVERRKLPSTTFSAVKTLTAPTIGTIINSYTDVITAGSGTYQYRLRVTGNGINLIGPVSPLVIVP